MFGEEYVTFLYYPKSHKFASLYFLYFYVILPGCKSTCKCLLYIRTVLQFIAAKNVVSLWAEMAGVKVLKNLHNPRKIRLDDRHINDSSHNCHRISVLIFN